MPGTIAVIAGKLSATAIKMLGLGLASNVPGRVSRKVSPTVLSELAAQSRKGVIAVSGTNGKSTTSGLVASILQKNGLQIVHNRQGANLVTGITTAVVNASGWTGGLDADYCLFEIDEAALPLVAKEVKITSVLVTNLFRDQLDRFGELDTTAKLIGKGIIEQQSIGVLNADDPNVAQMVPDCKRIFYGVESVVAAAAAPAASEQGKDSTLPEAGVAELSYCGDCGGELSYSVKFYGQIGHYECTRCGRKRPTPDVVGKDVQMTSTGSRFQILYGDRTLQIDLPLPGIFNMYNALAAAALCFSIGIPADAVQAGLSEYTTLFGRSERIQINGKSILIQLIKNPAGASQAARAAAADPNARIMVAINDNYADGRDVSWLWDAEFECLASCRPPFVISGTRCHDMAVRMKYAGVDAQNIKVEQSLDSALDLALAGVGVNETLWLLPTYTCLLELQKIFRSRGIHLSGT